MYRPTKPVEKTKVPSYQSNKEQLGIERTFKRISLKPNQNGFPNGNGRQFGHLASSCVKPNWFAKNVAHGGTNSIMSKTGQFPGSQKPKGPSKEQLGKSINSCDGWVLQGSKGSATKVQAQPVKATASLLSQNRFYELRDKSPVPNKPEQLKKDIAGTSNKANKGKVVKQHMDMDIWWNPCAVGDIQSIQHSTSGASSALAPNRNSTNPFRTFWNSYGTGNQMSNWRQRFDSNSLVELDTLCSLESSRVITETHLKTKVEEVPLRGRKPSVSEKIVSLRNLAEPGAGLWVPKLDHQDFKDVECVKILPAHHQCAGPERYVTPIDLDPKMLARELEIHRRTPKFGSKTTECICLRKTRRAYCTVCKASIVGRVYRKCQVHPGVGFLSDHFYCPYCKAKPSDLEDM